MTCREKPEWTEYVTVEVRGRFYRVTSVEQRRDGRRHARLVQRPVHPPRQTAPERGTRTAVHDAIEITTAHRAEACMEIVVDRAHRAQRDVCGEMAVAAQQPGVVVTLGRGIEMDDLAGRMHARIGASRAGHLDRVVGNPRERLFDRALHGALPRLALPAGEAATVVLDPEGDAHGNSPGRAGAAPAPCGDVRDQPGIRPSSSSALAFCASLPSATTSSRMPLAPSKSSMSR